MKVKSRKQLEKQNTILRNALLEIAYCMSSKKFEYIEITKGVNKLSSYALDTVRSVEHE